MTKLYQCGLFLFLFAARIACAQPDTIKANTVKPDTTQPDTAEPVLGKPGRDRFDTVEANTVDLMLPRVVSDTNRVIIDSVLFDLLQRRMAPRWRFVAEVEAGFGGATAVRTPFWLRANQYGTVPLTSPAGWLRGRVSGQTQIWPGTARQAVVFKYGAELVGMAAVPSYADRYRVVPVELYGQVRWRHWEVYAGRRRDMFGLVDTLLSSGSFAWSGSAVPLPRVQIGTWDYVPVPFTHNWLAFNTMYAHGWFGNTADIRDSYLHQKALFVRIGQPDRGVRLYAGITHYVQWGGQVVRPNTGQTVNPKDNLPSDSKAYWYVITGAQPPAADTAIINKNDALNAIGNHLGTMDAALEWTDRRGSWLAYLQHPFEDKSGTLWLNTPDGLYGIRWQRRGDTRRGRWQLTHVTAEWLTTLDQSNGAKRRRLSYDEGDNYFNNTVYVNGWTYRDHSLGNPFLTRKLETTLFWQKEIAGKVISGNTGQTFYLGVMGNLPNGWPFRFRFSQSWYDPEYNAHRKPERVIPQTSASAEVTIPWRGLGGTEIRAAAAFDAGQWLRESFGFQARLVKRW
jgi:Capsule assembly protein Wzi